MKAEFPHRFKPLAAQQPKALNLPAFDSFPYLVTHLVSCLYHLTLLPQSYEPALLRFVAQRQVLANQLQTCLVRGKQDCLYFAPTGVVEHSTQIPRGGFAVCGKLQLCISLKQDEELKAREQILAVYEQRCRIDGYVFGDLTKGGRDANDEERLRLLGRQENGIPRGLIQCSVCGEWKGECLDPSPTFAAKLMRVWCVCDNNNRCAACGGLLHSRKLNANYFDRHDGQIWHVPGFSALGHCCEGVE